MKPTPFNKFIVRVPQFPYTATLEESWEELKKSIRLSSPDFYQLISEVSAGELGQLPEKVAGTVRRYFNRARFRAIPHSTFASWSVCEPAKTGDVDALTVSQNLTVRKLVDWKQTKQATPYTFNDIVQGNRCLFANSSYYRIEDRLRYLTSEDDRFELSDIDYNPLLVRIMSAAARPVTITKLQEAVAADFPDEKELLEIIEQMIAAQLLFTEYDPNIIGEDYMERRGIQSASSIPPYVLSARKQVKGKLPDKLFHQLYDYLMLVSSLQKEPDVPEELASFKQRFFRRFERQQVPIMVALDPEIGVGYGSSDRAATTGDLVASFLNPTEDPGRVSEKFRDFLIAESGSCETTGVVQLDRFTAARGREGQPPLPNTVSCMFSVADELLVLDQAGGYSTNQLAGRFSVLDEASYDFCREIARMETEANPGVLFFDIAYLAEPGIDNVNRRKRIYDYEVNILNYCHGGDPITLDDIYINVDGREIILRSKRLGKRLIPRMASAYNYKRSDLPLFKFLCDLMYHGIQADFSLRIPELLPGRRFYPRMQYKNVVVAPASWKLYYGELAGSGKADGTEGHLEQKLAKLGVSRFIRMGTGDQTLCLDITCSADRTELLRQLKAEKEMFVEEAILPKSSIVRDEAGKPYMAQFILPLVHRENIYYSSAPVEDYDPALRAVFAPGSEWLSFEIYCHPQRMDLVLREKISLILGQHQDKIRKWFFIRYSENGNHLRLRLQLNKPEQSGILIQALELLLSDNLASGIVSDIVLRTYRRERERYAVAGMDQVETTFFEDSQYILNMLECMLEDRQKYQLCYRLFDQVRRSGLLEETRLSNWIGFICKSFNEEHHVTREGTLKINRLFKENIFSGSPSLTANVERCFSRVTEAYLQTLGNCPDIRRAPLFTDLLHMHINRLFHEHQRTHEMIFYNLLLLTLKKESALAVVPQTATGNQSV